jgi:DNA-binding MarR family transcriptional regulator
MATRKQTRPRAGKATATVPATARDVIRQTRPFRSSAQEALVTLLVTTEAVRWPIADFLAERTDLTLQQYNVLRILRGAGPDGLPTLEIGERMIERMPGVTRLLDRLEHKGLCVRERSADDRRQVLCRLTDAGQAILASLDAPIDELDERLLSALTRSEQRELVRLCDKLRQGLD